MDITGKSKIMFVLADPVDHVRASAIINAYFRSIGEDVATSPLHVRPDDLPTVIAAIRVMGNVVGFGVTIPHKVAILPLLDDVTSGARAIGAVNFVKRTAEGRLVGDNLDAPGFISGLLANGFDVAGKKVLQVGAGGAGRATAIALATAGVGELVISNRDLAKAEALAATAAALHPGVRVLAGPAAAEDFDLVVNTTSLGMKPEDALPIDIGRIGAATTVCDIIVNPLVTPLMALAQSRGAQAIGGKPMLDAQMSLVAAFIQR